MKVKEESEKVGLTLNIQKTKIMASGPTTSWIIEGEKLETKMLAPWKKSYDKPRKCIKKHRHHFADKGLSKSYDFSIVMYRFDSWTIKNAEHRRTDAFKLWCWKRLLSPLDSKEIKPANPKGNQS